MTTAHDKAQAVANGMKVLAPIAGEFANSHEMVTVLMRPDFWEAMEKGGDKAALKVARRAAVCLRKFSERYAERRPALALN